MTLMSFGSFMSFMSFEILLLAAIGARYRSRP
jgi:hypothetical protein